MEGLGWRGAPHPGSLATITSQEPGRGALVLAVLTTRGLFFLILVDRQYPPKGPIMFDREDTLLAALGVVLIAVAGSWKVAVLVVVLLGAVCVSAAPLREAFVSGGYVGRGGYAGSGLRRYAVSTQTPCHSAISPLRAVE